MSSVLGNETFSGIGLEQYIWNFYYGYFYQVYYPLSLFFCIVGTLTNLVNVAVFTQKEMRNSLNFLLTSLSLSDIVFYLDRATVSVIYFACPTMNLHTTVHSIVWINGLYLMESTTLMLSEWLHVVIGACRFVVITWPLRAKELFNVRRAKVTVICLAISSLVLSSPCFYFMKLQDQKLHGQPVTIIIARMFENFNYMVVRYVLQAVVCIAMTLPIPVAMAITGCLIWNMRQAMKSRHQLSATVQKDCSRSQSVRTTLMLTLLLIVFTATNAPSTVLNISYYFKFFSITKHHNILWLFQELDKMATFFIYFFMSSNYKKTFRRIFKFSKHAVHPCDVQPKLKTVNSI